MAAAGVLGGTLPTTHPLRGTVTPEVYLHTEPYFTVRGMASELGEADCIFGRPPPQSGESGVPYWIDASRQQSFHRYFEFHLDSVADWIRARRME